jgi:hypothetical protein
MQLQDHRLRLGGYELHLRLLQWLLQRVYAEYAALFSAIGTDLYGDFDGLQVEYDAKLSIRQWLLHERQQCLLPLRI